MSGSAAKKQSVLRLQLWKLADIVVPAERKRPVNEAAVKRLAESIGEIGLQNPITITPSGVLITGLHRLESYRLLGRLEIPAIPINLDDLHRELAEIDENLIRNELTVLQRSEHLQRRMEIYEALHPQTKHGATGGGRNGKGTRRKTQDEIISPSVSTFTEDAASTLGVSQRTVQQEVQIARDLDDATKQAVRGTEIENSKTDLLDLARVKSTDERAAIVGKVASGQAKSVKEAKGKLRLDAKHKLAGELNAKPLPVATGQFNVIVIDPPWRYESRAEDVTHRGRNPYPDMDLDAIKALPVGDRADDNCVLWLWATNSFMREAFECLDAWGFTHKTILTWAKDRMGTGDWLRGKTEHCLLAVRGRPTVILTNQTTLLEAPLREHSRKPDEFYSMVETLCSGSKLEFFSRQPRNGWRAWGAEVELFKEET